MDISKNRLLKDFSTFGIGGACDYFCSIRSESDLIQALDFAREEDIPILAIGKGSNSLFSDDGFRGLFLQIKLTDFFEDGNGLYKVGSGYSFARLGQITSQQGFCGLEFAAGIPASVGGAVFMNAGAAGQEVQNTLLYVDTIDYRGNYRRYLRQELEFSYRFSAFQKMKEIIISATFQLTPSSQARKVSEECVAYRLQTQPYKDKSCGCIFRNPSKEISAGKLIEDAGLKGFTLGGAMVSPMHANFIINRGGATASDIKQSIIHIREAVLRRSGYLLESEIKIFDQYGSLISW